MADQPKDPSQPKVEEPGKKESDSTDAGKTSSDKGTDVKTVKIGEEDVPFTEESFKEHYQKGADYTKKTQTLADDRKQFDERLDYVQQKEAELAERDKTLGKKPDAQPGELTDAALEKGLDLEPLDEFATANDKATRKAILKQERRTLEKQATDERTAQERSEASKLATNQEIESEIAEVEKKYGKVFDMNQKDENSDISKILDIALARQGRSRTVVSLTKIADQYAKRLDDTKDAHIKTYLAKKEEDSKTGVEKGTAGISASEPVKTSIGDGSAKRTFLETRRASRRD